MPSRITAGIGARSRVVLLVLLTLGSLNQDLSAQDFDRYRPNPPVPGRSVPTLPDLPNNPVEGSEDELVKALKGVMIVDHESRIQDPIKPFDGIKIDPAADLTVAREDQFKEILNPYIGKPITIRGLNEMARNIVLLYRDFKQPVVEVNVPPGQDITDGIVQLVITEARIGAIRFENNCWFSDDILQQQGWLRPGQRIFEPCLQQELVWYNKNPFREVGVELEPGDVAGTTDIVYNVKEKRPVRFYAGYDDTGTRATGLERLVFGVNWGNAWGKDRQLSYQYTTDADLGGTLGVHSIVYSVPIFENRDNWTVFGSWADISSAISGSGGLQNQGRAWQVSGRYTHTLCETECRVDTMHFGLDFKGTNSDLDFGGASIFASDVHVVNFMAGVNSVQRYEDGQTLYGVDVFASPGHLLTNNTTDAFNAVRQGARSTYAYLKGYVERQYEVDCRSDLVLRATGQIATSKLLPTEQLGFGGFNTIRGYDMRTLNGDSGYILNMEYRSKPIQRCCNGKQTSLTLLSFADMGQQFVWGKRSTGNAINDEILASAGVGMRYLVNPNATIRVDYGYPITQRFAQNENGRVHIGAVVAY